MAEKEAENNQVASRRVVSRRKSHLVRNLLIALGVLLGLYALAG